MISKWPLKGIWTPVFHFWRKKYDFNEKKQWKKQDLNLQSYSLKLSAIPTELIRLGIEFNSAAYLPQTVPAVAAVVCAVIEDKALPQTRPPLVVAAAAMAAMAAVSAPGIWNRYTVLHIFRQVMFGVGNQGNHQNLEKSLLSYKCWLIFIGMKQFFFFF